MSSRVPSDETAARPHDPPEADVGSAAGAPPSNTAPATSNNENKEVTRIVGAGVDSLYLSVPGTLREGTQALLSRLKEQAQARDPEVRSLSQYPVENWLFEVSDKGARRFAFVLSDSSYRIELARASAERLPMAHVQLSSLVLTAYGVEKAVADLLKILRALGNEVGEPIVSRADLFVDATTSCDLGGIEDRQWVTRAHDVARYADQNRRTGYAVGRGGDISLRLYDKTLEIQKHGKTHAMRRWEKNGWDGSATVWRTEVQFRRTALAGLGVRSVRDLMQDAGRLWHYATEKWCRLCAINAEDQTRSRWTIYPFWEAITATDDFKSATGAARRIFRNAGSPSDTKIVDMYLAALTSYMAKYEEFNTGWAIRDLIDLVELELRSRMESEGVEPARQIARKVMDKTRRYGTGAAFRVPPRIELRLDTAPRQGELTYGDDQ